jgi:opacity protein-like surface antigen
VDQRFFLMPKLTLGFGMSQQVFDDDKPYKTYQIESGAITAKVYEFTQIFQLKVLAHYYFLDRGPVQPFAGLGLGYGWADHSTSVADFTVQQDSSAFVLTPEVGVLFVFGENTPVGRGGRCGYCQTHSQQQQSYRLHGVLRR